MGFGARDAGVLSIGVDLRYGSSGGRKRDESRLWVAAPVTGSRNKSGGNEEEGVGLLLFGLVRPKMAALRWWLGLGFGFRGFWEERDEERE